MQQNKKNKQDIILPWMNESRLINHILYYLDGKSVARWMLCADFYNQEISQSDGWLLAEDVSVMTEAQLAMIRRYFNLPDLPISSSFYSPRTIKYLTGIQSRTKTIISASGDIEPTVKKDLEQLLEAINVTLRKKTEEIVNVPQQEGAAEREMRQRAMLAHVGKWNICVMIQTIFLYISHLTIERAGQLSKVFSQHQSLPVLKVIGDNAFKAIILNLHSAVDSDILSGLYQLFLDRMLAIELAYGCNIIHYFLWQKNEFALKFLFSNGSSHTIKKLLDQVSIYRQTAATIFANNQSFSRLYKHASAEKIWVETANPIQAVTAMPSYFTSLLSEMIRCGLSIDANNALVSDDSSADEDDSNANNALVSDDSADEDDSNANNALVSDDSADEDDSNANNALVSDDSSADEDDSNANNSLVSDDSADEDDSNANFLRIPLLFFTMPVYETMLTSAIWHGCFDNALHIRDCGGDINAPVDKKGYTALHWAFALLTLTICTKPVDILPAAVYLGISVYPCDQDTGSLSDWIPSGNEAIKRVIYETIGRCELGGHNQVLYFLYYINNLLSFGADRSNQANAENKNPEAFLHQGSASLLFEAFSDKYSSRAEGGLSLECLLPYPSS